MGKVDRLVESLRRNLVDVVISERPGWDAERLSGSGFVARALSAAADTGMIFLPGGDLKAKMVLSEQNVIILDQGDIAESAPKAFEVAIKKAGGDIFVVSSASKTSDIEGRLVWGMHGPAKVTVVIGVKHGGDLRDPGE